MVMKPMASIVNRNPIGTIIFILVITGFMILSVGYYGIDQEMSEESFTPDIERARANTEITEEYSAEYGLILLVKADNSKNDILTPEAMLELLDLEAALVNNEDVNAGLEQPAIGEANIASLVDAISITLIQDKLTESLEDLYEQQLQGLKIAINDSINEIFDGTLTTEQKTAMNSDFAAFVSESMVTVFDKSKSSLAIELDKTLPSAIQQIRIGLNQSLIALELQLKENLTSMIQANNIDQELLGTLINQTIYQISFITGDGLNTALTEPLNKTLFELSNTIGYSVGLGLGAQMEQLAGQYNSRLNQRITENMSMILGIPYDDALAMLTVDQPGSNNSESSDPTTQLFEALNQTITNEVQNAMLDFGQELQTKLNSSIEDLILQFSSYAGYQFSSALTQIITDSQMVLASAKSMDDLNTTVSQELLKVNSSLVYEINTNWTGERLAEIAITDAESTLYQTSRFNTSLENVAYSLLVIMKQGAQANIGQLETMFTSGSSTNGNDDQLRDEFNKLLGSMTIDDKKKTIAGGNIEITLLGNPIILQFQSMDETSFKGYIKNLLTIQDANYTQLQAGIEVLLTREFDPVNDSVKAKGTIISMSLNASLETEQQEELEHQIDDVVTAFENDETENFVITTIGGAIIMDEILSATNDSLSIIMPVAFILVILILALVYRNGFDMGVSLLALVFSILWVYGAGALLGYTFNPITLAIPVLIIGLGIDYGIHITMRYREELSKGKDIRKSIRLTILSVGVALLLATFTTVVSFLSNLSSPISLLQEFGILCSIGILGSFITMITFVPACKQLRDERRLRLGKPLKYLNTNNNYNNNNVKSSKNSGNESNKNGKKVKTSGGVFLLEKFMASSARGAYKHPGAIIGVTLVITLASLWGAMQLETKFEMEDFLPEELDITQDFYFIRDEFGFDFESGGDTNFLIKGDIAQPAVLRDIQRTIDNAADNNDVSLVEGTNELNRNSILDVIQEYATRTDLPGVTDLKYSPEFESLYTCCIDPETGLPRANATPERIKTVFDWLYDNPDTNIVKDVSRVLHRSEDGKYDGAVIRIAVLVDPNDGEKINRLLNQFKDDIEPLEKNEYVDDIIITSGPILTFIIMDAMNTSQTNTLIITIIVALITLLVVYGINEKSVMLGFITIIPVLICVAWIWGSMFVLELPLNVMTITIASLTIGLGITYSIHITHRFIEDIEKKSIEDATISTVSHTGTALFGAAATTIAGFGILVFALLPPVQQFGGITAITILYSFLSSVFILPAFLVLWAKWCEKHGKIKRNNEK